MKKGGVFDKDTHLSSRGAHAIRLFHQPKRALSRGFIDGFGEKSENRPKKANENAEDSAQNAGLSTKILRFFSESSRLLLLTRRPSDPKASENECTLPTMGEEMPTTPRPSRDFIDRHRRNEEPHPTF